MLGGGRKVGSRPQRDHHHSAVILERDYELALIETAVARARAGNGGLLVVEGQGGIGKTRLVSAATVSARAAGVTVLSARGAELEQDFTFGIVRQLLDPAMVGSYALAQPRSVPGAAWRALTALELIRGASDAAA